MTIVVHRAIRSEIQGFALVEVILALVLMAMIAAVVLPGLRPAQGAAALRTTAYQLTALLRDARTMAISMGRPTKATVSPTRVSLRGGPVIDLPSGFAAVLSGHTAPAIAFAPDGTSSGGDIVLQGQMTRLVISVNADTGAIRLATP